MSAAMRTVSFKLPASLDKALDDLARRRRASRSAIVREALEAMTTAPQRSVADAAGDLVGRFEGPEDLATNPNYMADFGT